MKRSLIMIFSILLLSNIIFANQETETEQLDNNEKITSAWFGFRFGCGYSGITKSDNIPAYDGGRLFSWFGGLQVDYFLNRWLGFSFSVDFHNYHYGIKNGYKNDGGYNSLDFSLGLIFRFKNIFLYIGPSTAMHIGRSIFTKEDTKKMVFGYSTSIGFYLSLRKVLTPVFINYKMGLTDYSDNAKKSRIWALFFVTGFLFGL